MTIQSNNIDIKAPFIHISKLDVAKRQLEIAIRLFFKSEDVVAMHTLAAAAHQILTDLSGMQGKTSFLKHETKKYIKPEKHSDWDKIIREAGNFFKHADRDPDNIFKFHYKPTEFFILDAIMMYYELVTDKPPYFQIYFTWFFASNPDVINEGEYKKSAIRIASTIDPKDKAKYLNLLPLIDPV
jgi:hypothetical protein